MHCIQRVTRAAETMLSGHLHLRSRENGVNFFLPTMKVFQDSQSVETKEWIQRYMKHSYSKDWAWRNHTLSTPDSQVHSEKGW